MVSNFMKLAAAAAAAFVLSVGTVPEASAGGFTCDNDVCETGGGENCSNCPSDCGACCGNSVPNVGEGCDDGGVTADDGCSAACLVENGYPCGTEPFVPGDTSCESGVCDQMESTPTCEPANTCGNHECEAGNEENCASCAEDCGACTTTTLAETTTTSVPDTTSTTVPDTTSTTVADTTSTTLPETTTTTLAIDTTTTTVFETTSTTQPPLGSCCFAGLCQDVQQDYCEGELVGIWTADSSCDDPGICVNCGDGCLDFGEQCDDGDTFTADDGCNSDCQEDNCWSCSIGQITGDSLPPAVVCFGPSVCTEDEFCAECGNDVTEIGEQCDDGNTAGGDCCSASCQFEAVLSPCPDATNCDGAEFCNGSGSCVDAPDPTCDNLDTECTQGYCDFKANGCLTVEVPDGTPCDDNAGPCASGEGGTCQNGVCMGAATTLSPTCRWIVLGTSADSDVRVRTGPGSTVDDDMCGDTAKIGGITPADIVAVATTGEGIRFYGPPEVDGDIVTGGSTVRANLYLDIPGTNLKLVDTGMTVMKDPAGVVSTTGAHSLVDVCNDDQATLATAIPILDGMGDPLTEEGLANGLKVGIGSGYTIDVTGDGVAVVDMNGLKVGHGATLTLKGTASDVVMLRINGGRLKIGYGANVVLDGLVPENVLIYADGPRCRVSPGATGSGTVYCTEAGRLIVGAGVKWSGTFLGAAREVRIRSNADLTHIPFTGF